MSTFITAEQYNENSDSNLGHLAAAYSNYFNVKDVLAFAAAVAPYQVLVVHDDFWDSTGRTVCLDRADIGDWMCQNAEMRGEFFKVLQSHLDPNQTVILTSHYTHDLELVELNYYSIPSEGECGSFSESDIIKALTGSAIWPKNAVI